jgi:AcrR family transcriptional regulator
MRQKPNARTLGAQRLRVNGTSATRDRLLAAVRKLLIGHNPSDITTAMVLREANVARNTLYYHFDNHADLLDTAMLASFSEAVNENVKAFETALSQASSKDQFLGMVTDILQQTQTRSRRSFRIERCRLIIHAEFNRSFAAVMAAEQNRINSDFVKLFDQCREKGWMKGQVSSPAAAVFVQALTLGRVIDDVAGEKLPESDWLEMFSGILHSAIFGKQ